jgi:protein SCO1/2
MKTNPVWFLATFALAPFTGAAETAQPACCAAEKPACCIAHDSTSPAPAQLPARSLYQLEAKWTNDGGTQVALGSFRGQPVVVAMFFASCEYACPLLVGDMARLRDALPAETRAKTRFILVSFDTARDTPAALKGYRERMNLDSAWTLLRGDPDSVQNLAMLLGVKFKQDARGQFSHSNLLTILNAEGEIALQQAGLNGSVADAAAKVAATAR